MNYEFSRCFSSLLSWEPSLGEISKNNQSGESEPNNMQQLKRPSAVSSKVQAATERPKTTEVTRYDHLKKAAEQLMKSQVSSKAELSSMEAKLQKQENIIALQTTTLEKLREEKTKLQSILQNEKQQYDRLKFDMLALTTIAASLKKEMTSFASDVAQAGRDKESLIKENEELRSALKRLEVEIKTAIGERDSSKEQLTQREQDLVVANSVISRLEVESRETKEQLNVAQIALDALKVEAQKGRDELKKTASELCTVRGELSSLDERCTVLQIIERDLTSSVHDKENALAQVAIEMKAMEREKMSRIAELELQLANASSSFEQLKAENNSLVLLKSSLEEDTMRIKMEKDALCSDLDFLREENKALEARVSISETNYHLVYEEKRACTEEYAAKLASLEDKHRQEVEVLKSDLEEKLRSSAIHSEEKSREVVELLATIDLQRRDFSLALANEIQKQKELYQSQIDQLQKQIQDNEQKMERSKDTAVKEANPLELFDEDESDEVLSGSRDMDRRTILPTQQHRVAHEPVPKKVSAPAGKQKKIGNKPLVSEQSRRPALNPASHKKLQQVNSRTNKTKKKSKKTLDLFDDVFAFHG